MWSNAEDHALYLALNHDPILCQQAYRGLFQHQLPKAQLEDIHERLAYNYPLGNDRFREEIEAALGRQVGERKRGRPVTREEVAQI